MGFDEGELSVLLTGDRQISELNRHYLGREGPTNVLAFPMDEGPCTPAGPGPLGDVVISLDTALRESEATGESLEKTVDRLLVHGLLHLLGYDHERSPREARGMRREEARLLSLMQEG